MALTKTECGNGGEGLVFEDRYTIDGNSYGDLYELLAAADVLITDYSNTLFEFAMTGRPVFLYAPDKEEYAGTRGMYFDYDSLPFPIAKNARELADNIAAYDEEVYTKRQSGFFKKLGISHRIWLFYACFLSKKMQHNFRQGKCNTVLRLI